MDGRLRDGLVLLFMCKVRLRLRLSGARCALCKKAGPLAESAEAGGTSRPRGADATRRPVRHRCLEMKEREISCPPGAGITLLCVCVALEHPWFWIPRFCWVGYACAPVTAVDPYPPPSQYVNTHPPTPYLPTPSCKATKTSHAAESALYTCKS